MKFKNGKEMLKKIVDDCVDLYNPQYGVYVFVYNELGSIAYYYLDKEEVPDLAKEAEANNEYWGSLLGWGGHIVDSKEWYEEYYKEYYHATPKELKEYIDNRELPIDWCNRMFEGEWYNTDTYLKEVS